MMSPQTTPVRILAATIFALPVILAAIFALAILHHGSPGFQVDKTPKGLKVGRITQRINPIHPGDLIVGINGLDYNGVLSAFPGPDTDSRPPELTRLRAKRTLTFPAQTTGVSPFEFLADAWPHLLLMCLLLGLGIIAFVRSGSSRPALLFLLVAAMFAGTFSAALPSHFGLLDPETISLSFYALCICNWTAFGAYLHFAFTFPEQRDLTRNRKWMVAVFYLAAPALSLGTALAMSQSDGMFFAWLQRFRNMGLPLVVLLAFAKHALDYRALKPGMDQNQIKLILYAFWLSFGPYFLFYGIPNIINDAPLIPFRQVAVAGLFLPGAYAIALVRYRFLNVDKLIARTLSYSILIGLLFFAYSYLVVFLKRAFMGSELFTEEFVLLYLIAIAVAFDPLRRLISFAMDLFFIPRAIYSYRMMPEISRRIGATIELKALVDVVVRRLPEQINVPDMVLVVFERHGARVYPDTHSLARADLSYTSLESLVPPSVPHYFTDAETGTPTKNALLGTFRDADIQLVFPLNGGTGRSGLLLLGDRRDGRSYTGRDLELLATLASQTGLALENCLHHDSLARSKAQVEKMFIKVAQTKKMAALGEMSTILAHELKLPLASIRSAARYLETPAQDEQRRRDSLARIRHQVDGLEHMISNLLELARFKPPQFKTLNLSEHLTGLVHRWSQSGHHNPQVEIHLDAEIKAMDIVADPGQLQQIFLNCITNAEEAMPQGGRMEFSLARIRAGLVRIQLEDTGPGIPPEEMTRALEGFFSTKDKGMGIGLPVCRQLIQAHNGRMALKNLPQGGLRVTIDLPTDPLVDPLAPHGPAGRDAFSWQPAYSSWKMPESEEQI